MLAAEKRERLEADIRRACLKLDLELATTLALRGYGPEIHAFLVGFQRSEADAAEAFSLFSERVWKGLATFDWQSSFRTWAYAIARNVSLSQRAQSGKRAGRFVALPEGSFLSELAESVRSDTRSYLRTEVKDRVQRLRESLTDDEQMLLTLRVDRNLAWLDLARVLRDEAGNPTNDELARDAAKLRKRFQTIKEKLRALSDDDLATQKAK